MLLSVIPLSVSYLLHFFSFSFWVIQWVWFNFSSFLCGTAEKSEHIDTYRHTCIGFPTFFFLPSIAYLHCLYIIRFLSGFCGSVIHRWGVFCLIFVFNVCHCFHWTVMDFHGLYFRYISFWLAIYSYCILSI